MGGTKIIVLQLKQIIKSGLLTLLSLILLGFLIFLFLPKNSDKNKDDLKTESSIYIPGDYSSQIILHNKPINIKVSVNKNQIVSIDMNDISETQEVFYPLFKPTMKTIAREIIRYQTVDIPTIDDCAITGKILISAVDSALQKARLSS